MLSADWHLRYKNPGKRTDFFYGTQKMKVRWLLRLYEELQCDALLVSGDIFDSSSSPYLCIGDYIRMFLSKKKIKFITIFGQHDLRYHSLKSKKNTPLWSFLSALSSTTIDDSPYLDEDVSIGIYGSSWSQQIPVSGPEAFSILLIHTMVTKEGPLWLGQKPNSYTESGKLLKKGSNFNVIVSGDNHQSFHLEKNGRLLVNPGSIVRKTTTEKDYKPRVGILTIFEDHSYDFSWRYIPIQSSNIVFAEVDSTDEQQEFTFNPELTHFVESLKSHSMEKINFLKDLKASLEFMDDEETKLVITGIIDRIKQKQDKMGEL